MMLELLPAPPGNVRDRLFGEAIRIIGQEFVTPIQKHGRRITWGIPPHTNDSGPMHGLQVSLFLKNKKHEFTPKNVFGLILRVVGPEMEYELKAERTQPPNFFEDDHMRAMLADLEQYAHHEHSICMAALERLPSLYTQASAHMSNPVSNPLFGPLPLEIGFDDGTWTPGRMQ